MIKKTYYKIYRVLPPEPEYFYIENVSNEVCDVTLTKNGSTPEISLEKSTNGVSWTPCTTTSGSVLASIPVGGKVYFRGVNDRFGSSISKYNSIKGSQQHNVGGNIMSLIYGSDFDDKKTLTSSNNYCFYNLFYNDVKLLNTNDLKLPATTLSNYCYQSMFQGCSSLTSTPTLPATTLADNCYINMFSGCSSLTQAPALPATTLADNCYMNMFDSCTSLTQAPALPATTLEPYCYSWMFQGCSSLTQAPELPATTLASYCYNGMLSSCSSLVTTPELPATTLADGCYDSMFAWCESLTTTQELPATTLADYCYNSMFQGCQNLNYVKHNVTDWDTLHTQNWLNGVSSIGTMVCPADSTIPTNDESGIPYGWTREDI